MLETKYNSSNGTCDQHQHQPKKKKHKYFLAPLITTSKLRLLFDLLHRDRRKEEVRLLRARNRQLASPGPSSNNRNFYPNLTWSGCQEQPPGENKSSTERKNNMQRNPLRGSAPGKVLQMRVKQTLLC